MGKSLSTKPHIVKHSQPAGRKQKIFIIEKIKRPQHKIRRISKTGNWNPKEVVQLTVCTFMISKLKLRRLDLYRFITSRSPKQVRNKLKQDSQLIRVLVSGFHRTRHFDVPDFIEEDRLETLFWLLYREMIAFLNDFVTKQPNNKTLNKLLSMHLCCFGIEGGEIRRVLPEVDYSSGHFLSTVQGLNIQMTKEDYETFRTIKQIDGIPVLDYSTLLEFLENKYGFNIKN
jgi:hypothetical protein